MEAEGSLRGSREFLAYPKLPKTFSVRRTVHIVMINNYTNQFKRMIG